MPVQLTLIFNSILIQVGGWVTPALILEFFRALSSKTQKSYLHTDTFQGLTSVSVVRGEGIILTLWICSVTVTEKQPQIACKPENPDFVQVIFYKN